MEFRTQFNEAQQRAITAPLEPVLVLAGPGTGKTRTLVGRIVYLITQHQIAPHRILAVTFTNKATEEMQHRLREELGDAASDLHIGTFHRFCMTVLREHPAEAGLPTPFSIADDIAQLRTLSRVTRIQDERSLRTVLNAISSYRLNPDNLNPRFQAIAEKWLDRYHQELRRNKLIDFDQILLLTRAFLAREPAIVETYRQTFDAILVDEFQDTDPIQYSIMKALAREHRNIFAVADDDQSIFAWRGAHLENIDQFVSDFACRDNIIVLDQNYRSQQYIIDVATQLINCGPRFKQKQIKAATAADRLPQPQHLFLAFPDDQAEIQFITAQIRALTQPTDNQAALNYADIAILYPTHAIGERLEAALLGAQIPCQLVRRQGIFDQEDVRKIVLLLKLLQNPWDDLALEQFVELELHDPLVFEQIQSRKSRRATFKHTLEHLAHSGKVSGMSRGALRRLVTTTFGLISNLLTQIEQHPDLKLADLINTICNLTMPTQTATIHSHASRLSDPCDLPGVREAITMLRDNVAPGAILYIAGSDSLIADLCVALLRPLTPAWQVASLTDQPADTLPDIRTEDRILCLDAESVQRVGARFPALSAAQLLALNADTDAVGITIRSPFAPVVTVFKLVQAYTAAAIPRTFQDYVVFDLETTSGDTRMAGIVEIGAVKVRNGRVVDTFGTLVNPEQPITQGAYNVHHISDEDVRTARTFAEVLPDLQAFLGNDLLVAHNGFEFDFPILTRLYKAATGQTLSNRRFDTLPLARRLFPGQPASVDALMQRFNIQDSGERHRALDDTLYLAPIFEHLQTTEQAVNRRSEHEELLELVALGLYVSSLDGPADDEERLLFQLGAHKLLSRFSELPDRFQPVYRQHQDGLQQDLQDCLAADSGDAEDDALLHIFSGKDVAIARLKDLVSTFPAEPIQAAIARFLDHATLYTAQDDLREVNAVNLLTIHSAKGLEFPVVFVAGVEKGNLPSFYAVREEGDLGQKKLDEQRRLFYVALTRAKQQLFVTYVTKRGEYRKKRSQFLIELGIETEEAPPDEEAEESPMASR